MNNRISFDKTLRGKFRSNSFLLASTSFDFKLRRKIRLFLFLLIHFSRYAREFPDPYLSHGIGPVPGYGVRNASSIHFYVTNEFSESSQCFSCTIFRRQCIEEAIIVLRHIKISCCDQKQKPEQNLNQSDVLIFVYASMENCICKFSHTSIWVRKNGKTPNKPKPKAEASNW